ncbi:hypothetical protein ACP70R_021399 [Stipagrostis hirtigluma subsp. patula]
MAKFTAMAAGVAVMALLLLPLGQAQERHAEAHPHGLPFESPLALSPAAYDFFHPGARGSERARRAHGVAPALAPRGQQLMRASAVKGASTTSVARADHEEGGVAPPVRAVRRGALRAGALAGVFVGAAAVALVALGVAFAVARRRVVARARAEEGAPKSNA